MGLFTEEHTWHARKKRSWWDGTYYSWCGLAMPDTDVVEAWLNGSVNCKDCLKQKKKAGK